jgi:hypothetical protein
MNPPHDVETLRIELIALAVFAGAFLLFLLMREVWCWYWKLNSLLGELRLIRGLLERAEQRAAPAASEGPTQL